MRVALAVGWKGEVMTIRNLDDSWFRTLLLLSALSAGGVATLLVPPYRELASMPEEPRETVSAPATPGGSPDGMTGIDVDLRHLDFVQRIG
jgi:hypothetical protein